MEDGNRMPLGAEKRGLMVSSPKPCLAARMLTGPYECHPPAAERMVLPASRAFPMFSLEVESVPGAFLARSPSLVQGSPLSVHT